jgi:hypothetical protein
MTNLHRFVVAALVVLLACHFFGLTLLSGLTRALTAPFPQQFAAHSIETTWRSALGDERVCTLSSSADFRPWLEAHVAAVTEAQRVLPVKDKR